MKTINKLSFRNSEETAIEIRNLKLVMVAYVHWEAEVEYQVQEPAWATQDDL